MNPLKELMYMNTEGLFSDLNLLQITDSFFPAGLYSMSSGLETLFERGAVVSRQGVEDLVRMQIKQQIGPCDCVAAVNAHALAQAHDIGAIADLDATVMAMKAPNEAREAMARSGAQTLRAARQIKDDPLLVEYSSMVRDGGAAGSYPVALGMICHVIGIPADRTALSLLYGFAVSVVGAALRLGIIQHLEGQATLSSLGDDIVRAAKKSCHASVSDMWQFSPHLDICQMSHECAETRMFAT